jgi:hypothetical protein
VEAAAVVAVAVAVVAAGAVKERTKAVASVDFLSSC